MVNEPEDTETASDAGLDQDVDEVEEEADGESSAEDSASTSEESHDEHQSVDVIAQADGFGLGLFDDAELAEIQDRQRAAQIVAGEMADDEDEDSETESRTSE